MLAKREGSGDSMKRSLKESVADKFEEIELNSDQLARLELQVDAATRQPASLPRRLGRLAWLRVSAAALIFSIGVLLANQFYRSQHANELLEAIAIEVASNHLKLKPLEVKSQNLREVLSYFDRLDFQLLESKSIAVGAGDQLLGGRYCSIQGIDAAQLRVMSADGELNTWYEGTLPPGKLKQIPDTDSGAAPAELAVKGLSVRIWRQQGIVFAHARRPESGPG